MPEALAAACALIRAFSANVVPVSSGSGRPRSPAEISTSPRGVNSSRNSASLPALCVAISSLSPRLSRGRLAIGQRLLLHRRELGDAALRQPHQGVELVARERRLFG